MGRTHVGSFHEELHAVGGTLYRAGEEIKDKAMAEMTHYGLTTTTFPCSPVLVVARGRRARIEPGKEV